jgi:hypothetical protein
MAKYYELLAWLDEQLDKYELTASGWELVRDIVKQNSVEEEGDNGI